MSEDNADEFCSRMVEVALLAEDIFGVDLSNLKIEYTLRGRTAALAGLKNNRPYVNCNPEAIDKYCDGMCSVIAPHEIAHIVCDLKPFLGRSHNRGWRNVCRILGGDGKSRHNFDLSPARTVYTYLYRTTHNLSVEIGQTRHSRLQKKKVGWYASACHGKIFRWGFLAPIAYRPFNS